MPGIRKSTASCAHLTSLARSCRKAWRHHRIPVARGISLDAGADLSGLASGAAEPAQRSHERIEQAKPDAIHIATEGTIGFMARAWCRNHGRPFTTSYTTRFPEYISARWPIPERWIYAALRRFHAAAAVTMVATPSLMAELSQRGFGNLGMWTRGVDTDLFSPDRAINLDLPRPIFISVGRIAVEKNLEAFLSLDLPGTKVVIGAGPAGSRAAAAVSRCKVPRAPGKRQAVRSISRPPTSSSSQAGPTRSASCSSKRWPAAFRSRPFRSPARRT